MKERRHFNVHQQGPKTNSPPHCLSEGRPPNPNPPKKQKKPPINSKQQIKEKHKNLPRKGMLTEEQEHVLA